ncbi:hypothetical protein Y1Q_0002261 [Alligator mississippiensis]|uniref:Uncharacterized protein n=1 Tax=Alligator mississippiensis TaxID=8496 RepID=A0A151MGK4_ALLMI|nr:hypothetical protein Y1Q_0002261 [Alligator mississippiensis]
MSRKGTRFLIASPEDKISTAGKDNDQTICCTAEEKNTELERCELKLWLDHSSIDIHGSFFDNEYPKRAQRQDWVSEARNISIKDGLLIIK